MFSCGFFGAKYQRDGIFFRNGILVLPDTCEVFEAPLVEWNEEDYEASWELALHTVTGSAGQHAAIVTEFSGLREATYLDWWPMYRVKETITLQEQLLFLEPIRNQISLDNLFQFVSPRQEVKGEPPPSEWLLPVGELSQFLHCLRVARQA